jgi:hypothetical protein
VANFNYNDYQFKPYSDEQAFFHLIPEKPHLICDHLTFFQIPAVKKRISKGDYSTPMPVEVDVYLPLLQSMPENLPTPVIITVFQSETLKSFYVSLYFPKT